MVFLPDMGLSTLMIRDIAREKTVTEEIDNQYCTYNSFTCNFNGDISCYNS